MAVCLAALIAGAEALERSVIGYALNLNPVSLALLCARMGNLVLKPSVVREYKEAFTVTVQSAGGVDRGYVDMVRKAGTPFRVGERAQHTVGLVEQDDGRH